MINIDALNDDEKLAALESIHKSIEKSKEIQKKKITTNVELIVKALKKIESDFKQRYDETGSLIANLKNGEDGRDGRDGKDGKDGRAGKDGAMGPRGYDGVSGRNGLDGTDGVSVTDAHIDFDGSLIIHLSSGRVINVGEVVTPDIAEKIKVITNGGGTSQSVIDTLASLQAQITALSGFVNYEGTWNASTNTPALASSVGTKGEYYVVSTTGTTNLNGITAWTQGDWAIFNGTVWEKVDNTDLVTSVAGRTGAIVLTTADIGGLGTIATQAANNVSITGGSITGITDLAIADGGTGQSTAAAAITALTGTQTSGYYLRSNGTNASLSAIQAADVPTLNQNTTGSAATLSQTNPVSRGGTNLTSLTNKGVLYASSTSQVATGTALQFDGTNLGVGVTPSSWGSIHRAIEFGALGSLSYFVNGSIKETNLATNAYNATNTGARPYYKENGLATEYVQIVGEHAWFTAPTGIAGSSTTITTGKIYTNLTVGNQTDFGASSNAIGTIWTATSSGTLSSGTVVQNIDFVESMRIDASSNVGIGTAFPGSRLDVKGTLRLSGSTSGYVGLAPAAAAGSTTYTLPSSDGTNGQSLTTNGSGTLSWASGSGGTVTSVAQSFTGGLISVAGSPITSSGTLALTVAGTSGGIPYFSGTTSWASSGLLASNALMVGGGAATAPSTVTTGTGVVTALGVNTGSSGAFVVYSGALGTPSSGTVTNLTGTASININGTVGATTASTGAFTTLTTSSTVTLNGGTANGVAYLNGSKVVTSGSALTFDGTALGVSGTVNDALSVTSTATTTALKLNNTNANGWGSNVAILTGGTAAGYFGTIGSLIGSTAQDLAVYATASNGFRVYTNGNNERMRVTSGGDVGIGTSSPADKLEVYSTITARASSGTSALRLRNTTTDMQWQSVAGTNAVSLYDSGAGATRLTVDSSGNLGLGVTPSAWETGDKAFEVLNGGVWGRGNGLRLTGNVYWNGTNHKYLATDTAAIFAINYLSSGFAWFTAPSGTAGTNATLTQAMTLTAAGDLLVGRTTTPADGFARIAVLNSTDTAIQLTKSGVISTRITAVTTGLAFGVDASDGTTERARIDSSGRLLVGQTAIVVNNNNRAEFTGACGIGVISTGGAAFSGIQSWNQAGTGDNVFAEFFNDAGGTLRGSITYNRAGGLTVYNTTSDYRAKDIIGPVNNSGELIDSVPVYMGKMKDATQERPMFIAHETPAYAHTGEKDAVDADGNPVYQKMDASTLIPVMWAEIQSLRKRLADAGI